MIRFIHHNSMLSTQLYSYNETENAVYDELDTAVSKYVHGFKNNLNTDEI